MVHVHARVSAKDALELVEAGDDLGTGTAAAADTVQGDLEAFGLQVDDEVPVVRVGERAP